MADEIYNPLDKANLGASVAKALLEREIQPLKLGDRFDGAGVYAIYYVGGFAAYKPNAARNKDQKFAWPIYVGKAIPKGGRKGGYNLTAPPGSVLYSRLKEHAESIEQAKNLELADFFCRYLAVDDIWIPLGEQLLISTFKPLWNMVVDGFGNHDPGGGRYKQARSSWDVLHPGRPWAEKCAPGKKTEKEILEEITKALAHPETLTGPPKED